MLILLAGQVHAQPYNATIHGNFKLLPAGTWIYSQWYDVEHMSLGFDSVQNTVNGFTIPLQVEKGGGNQRVILLGKKGGGMCVFVDKGVIHLTSDDSTVDHVEISGSTFARDLNDFHHFINDHPLLASYDAVRAKNNAARRAKDSVSMRATEAQLYPADSLKKALSLKWIDGHLNSPISVYVMHSILEPLYGKLSVEEQEAVIKRLGPVAVNNQIARAMKYSIHTERLTGTGRIAPEFIQNDTLGKPVSLKSFRGKYVLLDFWASWCAPCRRENPNVVNAFNRYKEKGFTVLGVSLDQAGKKEAWLKAIHLDGLTWTHVSDLKYWNNAVAKIYDIKAVPANFLLGPDGTILAKNLRGDDLNKKLAELFQ